MLHVLAEKKVSKRWRFKIICGFIIALCTLASVAKGGRGAVGITPFRPD